MSLPIRLTGQMNPLNPMTINKKKIQRVLNAINDAMYIECIDGICSRMNVCWSLGIGEISSDEDQALYLIWETNQDNGKNGGHIFSAKALSESLIVGTNGLQLFDIYGEEVYITLYELEPIKI